VPLEPPLPASTAPPAPPAPDAAPPAPVDAPPVSAVEPPLPLVAPLFPPVGPPSFRAPVVVPVVVSAPPQAEASPNKAAEQPAATALITRDRVL